MPTRDDADDVIQGFRGVAGQLACVVTVVIALFEGEPHATTVSAFTAVSFAPPLVAVFFDAGSRTVNHLRSAGRFSLSVLGERDVGVARRCARPGRPSGWEGLAGVELARRDPAPPVLAKALAWLDCEVSEVTTMGDHECFLGRVLTVGRRTDAGPLLYYRGRFHLLGPSIAPAPWAALDGADLLAGW